MAEQEDLEQQLNNVSDDDGSELEESELSVNRSQKKNIVSLQYFFFLDNKNF
jgi:hypothetical protein